MNRFDAERLNFTSNSAADPAFEKDAAPEAPRVVFSHFPGFSPGPDDPHFRASFSGTQAAARSAVAGRSFNTPAADGSALLVGIDNFRDFVAPTVAQMFRMMGRSASTRGDFWRIDGQKYHCAGRLPVTNFCASTSVAAGSMIFAVTSTTRVTSDACSDGRDLQRV